MKLYVSIIFEIVVIILFYVRYKRYKMENPTKKHTGLYNYYSKINNKTF
jgi:hypothetical protein